MENYETQGRKERGLVGWLVDSRSRTRKFLPFLSFKGWLNIVKQMSNEKKKAGKNKRMNLHFTLNVHVVGVIKRAIFHIDQNWCRSVCNVYNEFLTTQNKHFVSKWNIYHLVSRKKISSSHFQPLSAEQTLKRVYLRRRIFFGQKYPLRMYVLQFC